MSSEDDRLIGEIHATVKSLDGRVGRIETKLDGIASGGCAVGKANCEKISSMDKRMWAAVIAVPSLLLGALEALKAIGTK